MARLARLVGFVCMLSPLAACGPVGPGVGADAGEESGSETGDVPLEGATLAWVATPDRCASAYGVLHRGDDAVVVGSSQGQPWMLRVDALGETVWEVVGDTPGGYFAIAEDSDPAAGRFVVAGSSSLPDGEFGLLEWFTDAGELDASFVDVGGPGSELYGVASLPDGLVVTGIVNDFDMLVGRVDASDGSLDAWAAPVGFGLAPSVGFGVRTDAAGVAVCGRQSAGEGGRSWAARYDASGNSQWEARGPDPGVGAFSDCWGLAIGPSGDVFVADYGYPGAHLAGFAAADGAELWSASEPSTGVQAIDVGPDGTIYVGGWSADSSADPFRSHETGERSGWLAAFEPSGELRWRVAAAMPLSIHALRVHAEGDYVTVVGVLLDGECSQPWIARYLLD